MYIQNLVGEPDPAMVDNKEFTDTHRRQSQMLNGSRWVAENPYYANIQAGLANGPPKESAVVTTSIGGDEEGVEGGEEGEDAKNIGGGKAGAARGREIAFIRRHAGLKAFIMDIFKKVEPDWKPVDEPQAPVGIVINDNRNFSFDQQEGIVPCTPAFNGPVDIFYPMYWLKVKNARGAEGGKPKSGGEGGAGKDSAGKPAGSPVNDKWPCATFDPMVRKLRVSIQAFIGDARTLDTQFLDKKMAVSLVYIDAMFGVHNTDYDPYKTPASEVCDHS